MFQIHFLVSGFVRFIYNLRSALCFPLPSDMQSDFIINLQIEDMRSIYDKYLLRLDGRNMADVFHHRQI